MEFSPNRERPPSEERFSSASNILEIVKVVFTAGRISTCRRHRHRTADQIEIAVPVEVRQAGSGGPFRINRLAIRFQGAAKPEYGKILFISPHIFKVEDPARHVT